MTKAHKISLIIISVTLSVACLIGITTRLSYKYIDSDEAIYYSHNKQSNIAVFEKLNKKQVSHDLKNAESVFVVTVKKSERNYNTTKATAQVNRVIKGDQNEFNNEIVIYEANFLDYSKTTKQLYYYPINHVNNLMQVDKEYLVFCEKIDYAESYKNALPNTEYIVEWDWSLYSFPLEYEAAYMDVNSDEDLRYKDFKDYDYICFNEKDAKKIDEIRKDILDEYL